MRALLLCLLLTGCVSAYATHDRVVAVAVGSTQVHVCEQATEEEPNPAPCIRVEGAALSAQGANVLEGFIKLLWSAVKLVVPLI